MDLIYALHKCQIGNQDLSFKIGSPFTHHSSQTKFLRLTNDPKTAAKTTKIGVVLVVFPDD